MFLVNFIYSTFDFRSMYPDREMRLLVVDFSDWHTTIRESDYCCQTAVFRNALKKNCSIGITYFDDYFVYMSEIYFSSMNWFYLTYSCRIWWRALSFYMFLTEAVSWVEEEWRWNLSQYIWNVGIFKWIRGLFVYLVIYALYKILHIILFCCTAC